MGRGVDHPPPPSAEVRERVERNLYVSSVPALARKGATFLPVYLCFKYGV